MLDLKIFDVPVYRIDFKEFIDESRIKKEKSLEVVSESAYQDVKTYYENKYEYPWKYNEIIGFIELYIVPNKIKGQLYFVQTQRVKRGIKKIYQYKAGARFEVSINLTATPQEFTNHIIMSISDFQKSKSYLVRRYIDTKQIEIIGPQIDWGKLFDMI